MAAIATPEGSASQRRVDTLIIDTGPILSSAAAPSYYLTAADRILTTPSVLGEIRDPAGRSRFDTLWRPFVTIRAPKPESVKKVAEFAKKTGDYNVLSAVDLGLIALAYEVECEVAGGDWRLREVPGGELKGPLKEGWGWEGKIIEDEKKPESKKETTAEELTEKLESTHIEPTPVTETTPESFHAPTPLITDDYDSDDSDGGWITPSNLHKHVSAPTDDSATTTTPTQKLPAALSTTDFAMQNVTLQMNLHLLSPASLQRITHTRSYVLRCHACFYVIRHPSSVKSTDFCPRCGGLKTLLRTTCSTTPDGGFQIHLKSNFQYRVRGNVYSLPKPTAGTSSMKGVKDAPVLREDQKEYQRAVKWEGYRKEKDLLDQDSLPGILSGERRRGSAIRIGVGRRNPNEPKRGGGKRKK